MKKKGYFVYLIFLLIIIIIFTCRVALEDSNTSKEKETSNTSSSSSQSSQVSSVSSSSSSSSSSQSSQVSSVSSSSSSSSSSQSSQVSSVSSQSSSVGAIGDVRITNNANISEFPFAVWTGTEFGVVWSDNRDGRYEIYLARVDKNGNITGGPYRITNKTSGDSKYPKMVYASNTFNIVWQDNRNGDWDIYFAMVTTNGVVSITTRVTSDTNSQTYPTIATNVGDYFGVAWCDNRDGNEEIYFRGITGSGSLMGTSDVKITNDSASSRNPSIVYNGSSNLNGSYYGLTWTDSRDGNGEIYFAHLSYTGAKQTSDIRITQTTTESDCSFLVWNGSEYGVVWQEGTNKIYFARINSNGSKQGQDVQVNDGTSYQATMPSISWNSTSSQYGVVWQDYRMDTMNLEIYFARISSGAKMGTDVRVTNDEMYNSRYPVVAAFNDSGVARYGVFWQDVRDGNEEIYYAKLDSDGTKM